MADEYDKVPQSVLDNVHDAHVEGNEVFCTTGPDDSMNWIIVHENIKFITIYQWAPGLKEAQMINIEGPTALRLYKVMTEFNIGV